MKPKAFYIKRYHKISNLILNNYEVEIKRHALIRAFQRQITPDMIEATIRGGKIIRFGKNNMRFVKKYKRFMVVCIDEITGNKIKIVTVEKK